MDADIVADYQMSRQTSFVRRRLTVLERPDLSAWAEGTLEQIGVTYENVTCKSTFDVLKLKVDGKTKQKTLDRTVASTFENRFDYECSIIDELCDRFRKSEIPQAS